MVLTAPRTAADLVAHLAARGVELQTDGRRIRRVGPAGAVDAGTAIAIRGMKDELVPLIAPGWCGCGRRTDAARRCWHCHDRPCVACGKMTGSAFIRTCSAPACVADPRADDPA